MGTACPRALPPHKRVGRWILGTMIGCEDKGHFHPRLCRSRARETTVGSYKGSASETTQTSVINMSQEPNTGPPCFSTPPPLGKGSQYWERGKIYTSRENSQVGLTHRASASDKALTATSREKVPHHTIALASPSPAPPTTTVTAASTS